MLSIVSDLQIALIIFISIFIAAFRNMETTCVIEYYEIMPESLFDSNQRRLRLVFLYIKVLVSVSG